MRIDQFKDLLTTKDNQLQVVEHQNETNVINLEFQLQKLKKDLEILRNESDGMKGK